MPEGFLSLAGVRVLDLTRVLAGPFATQLMAAMGADVVKVEWGEGDGTRLVGPFLEHRSLYFASVNNGKRSVRLDPKVVTEMAQIEGLIRSADIVVENFRRESAKDLSLEPDRIRQLNPRAIVVTISGYGSVDGYADRAAYDLTIQAAAGLMSVTGAPEDSPMRSGVPISDLAGGFSAVIAALAGLHRRHCTGQGGHYAVPLFDVTLSLLAYMATTALHSGNNPARVGTGHHQACPYGAYRTADGWVTIAVLSDKLWPALCAALGLDDLAARPELATGPHRVLCRAEIDKVVADAVARLRSAEVDERLTEHGVPTAVVNTVLQALSSPYVRERGLVHDYSTSDGSYRVVHGPLIERPLSPAPKLGSDTQIVLQEWLDARQASQAESGHEEE